MVEKIKTITVSRKSFKSKFFKGIPKQGKRKTLTKGQISQLRDLGSKSSILTLKGLNFFTKIAGKGELKSWNIMGRKAVKIREATTDKNTVKKGFRIVIK